MSKVNKSPKVKVVKGSGIDLATELAGIRAELQAQVEAQATGVKNDLLARLVIIAQAVQDLSGRVSAIQDTTSQLGQRRARKPRKPPTPEQVALLAKNRDEWFKKMGYGPYANKTAQAVATEPQDQPKAEPMDLISKITA